MVGRHHCLNGHECEQALEDGEGPGSPVRCSPLGRKESDTTERLNTTKALRQMRLVCSRNCQKTCGWFGEGGEKE